MANIFYAQSGGVTPVINASALGVIETARKHKNIFKNIYAGRFGIIGALNEELIDINQENPSHIASLLYTPGGAFGSCRYKLKSLEENRAEYNKLIEVFKKYNIKYFFYNGGGDSQDTALKVSQLGITAIGIPKTIDNDLPITDNSPGFGSVAKYIAISTQEAALDVASMCSSSTKVFILEVMGRHAGWLAAASALGQNYPTKAPHIILLPEIVFNPEKFCAEVKNQVTQNGYCVVVASEGIKYSNNQFVAESGLKDAFGHSQLGGVASNLANLVREKLGYKYHYAIADYLQRAARHIASQTDLDQAYALGQAAVELAVAGKTGVMPTIIRTSNNPYTWKTGYTELEKVANQEKKLPKDFISGNGFGVTEKCLEYLRPLIVGEAYPPYHENGMPRYVELEYPPVRLRSATPNDGINLI